MAVLILGTSVKKSATQRSFAQQTASWWNFQSIDTMKFSRDPSRQYLSDIKTLQTISDQQAKAISETGATYIAIGTPYDEEFLPVLTTWVTAARKYHLRVWFRGNWSGWEGWFSYPTISRDEHFQKTKVFVEKNPHLFEDGDIFSACPECENGGPGDPRKTGDVQGHREFLIREYQMLTDEFKAQDKRIQVNFNSMNKDVADLVMDKPTTTALGGLVVIDHYVKDPTQLNDDVTEVASRSGGQVVLGEFGAPIPDIHGTMTDDEQAQWVKDVLKLLSANPHLVGLNYWTDMGGSTAIWNDHGDAKPAVAVIQKFYTPKVVVGTITNTAGNTVDQVTFRSDRDNVLAVGRNFQVPYLNTDESITVTAPGYKNSTFTVSELIENAHISLTPENPDFWYQANAWFSHLFQ